MTLLPPVSESSIVVSLRNAALDFRPSVETVELSSTTPGYHVECTLSIRLAMP